MGSSRIAVVAFRALVAAACLRMAVGVTALLWPGVWRWGLIDDAWILVCCSLGSVVMVRSWPVWAAVVALTASSFASAPMEMAGLSASWFPVHLLGAAVLWVAALQIPEPMRGVGRMVSVLACSASAALAAAAALGFDPPWPRLYESGERCWEWLAPSFTVAAIVVGFRCVRFGYRLGSYCLAALVGLLPVFSLLTLWVVTGAEWVESPSVTVPANLWVSVAPALMVAIYARERGDSGHGARRGS